MLYATHTIQCIDPETGKRGCWIFIGTDHKARGTAVSPVFSDCADLFLWMLREYLTSLTNHNKE